jgi:plastocyanin
MRPGTRITTIMEAAALGVLMLTAGCRSNKAAPAPKLHYTAIDWSTAGTIQGTIHYAGTPPRPILIDMSQDPGCSFGPPNYTEGYVVHDGGFANVFVYVKSGLGQRVYAPPSTPVSIDQKGCRYVPHVVGVMAGQPVQFTNSDPTMHNIHIMPMVAGNQEVDISQPPGHEQNEVTFHEPELMIPVRCNNHPWMQGFIDVAANPFYAVSDSTGHYVIRGVPPGTYTLTTDQENMGEKTVKVTVGPKQTVTRDFTYGRPAAAR